MDNEQKKKRIELAIKWIGGLAIGFLVAPFVWIALGGLIGLIISGVISFTCWKFTGWFAMKIANWRLKAIKAEAMKNPIETLQNDFKRRQEALGQFRESIVKFTSEIANFADKLVGFNKQYPDEAEKFKVQLNKMKQLLNLRENKYREADKNLDEYSMEIKKASAIWDMGQAAVEMNKAAGMSEDDFFAKISVETALDSVQKNLNASFAELELSLLDEKELPAVTQTKVLPDLINKSIEISSTPTKRAIIN